MSHRCASRLLAVALVGLLAVCATSGASLDLSATNSLVCPVIRYATAVEEMSSADLTHMKLNALQRDQAAAAVANHAAPYRVVVTAISYAKNTTVPVVDWIDLHFRVNQESQQNVQMKPVRAADAAAAVHSATVPIQSAAVAPELDATMMKGASSAPVHAAPVYSFGPIFLTAADELSFAHTICSASVDCNTPTHSFKPAEHQQDHAAAVAEKHANSQSQAVQHSEPNAAVESPPVPPAVTSAPAPSPTLMSHAEIASAVCPSIAFKHKVTCGDFNCKLSFVNLSPHKPADWVDVHVSSNALSFLSTAGLSALDASTHLVTQNSRMELVAGPKGRLSEAAPSSNQLMVSAALFGPDSSPSSVLASTAGASENGVQVWQFGLPLAFHSGDHIEVSFTYSASGVDCDTDASTYTLRDEEELHQHADVKAAASAPKAVAEQPKVASASAASIPSAAAAPTSSQSPRPITIVTTTDTVMLPLSVARSMLTQPNSATHSQAQMAH